MGLGFDLQEFWCLCDFVFMMLMTIDPSGSFLELSSKDLSDLAESLFFTASRGRAIGRFGLRADALVGHLKDTLKLLLDAFGQLKGIGLIA